MMDRHCKGCARRYPGCHDACGDYKLDAEKHGRLEAKIRKARAKEQADRDYVWQHYDSRRRH